MTRDELGIHASEPIHEGLVAATRAGCTPDEIAKALHDLASTKG
jgi:hypothetical protein